MDVRRIAGGDAFVLVAPIASELVSKKILIRARFCLVNASNGIRNWPSTSFSSPRLSQTDGEYLFSMLNLMKKAIGFITFSETFSS
jgi:hypothetical protein